MRAICPHCRKRIRFSFWRIDAMSLQCPVCHTYAFDRFRTIEALSIVAGLGLIGFAVLKLELKWYIVPILLVALIGFEYILRLVYIWIQNTLNENL